MYPVNYAVLALAALLPGLASAVPVKFPECAKKVSVRDIEGSGRSYLNEDCTVLYVLPPAKGVLSISGYRPDANLNDLCGKLKKIDEDGLNLQNIITTDSRRLAKLKLEIEKMEDNARAGLIPVGETVESMEERAEKLRERAEKLRQSISGYQTENDNRRLQFSKGEGGRGVFVIENAYSKLLEDYRRVNPHLEVRAMPIDQSYVSVNEQKPEESEAASMPAVRKLRIPGVGELPLLLDPKILMQHKDLVPQKGPAGSVIFGDSLGGEIIVSNIGACALQKAIGSSNSFRAKEVKAYVAANATYGYQVQVTRSHSITYNFKKLIEIIHEQTKRGGFFSSKTINSVIDNRRTSEWIEFKVDSQDGRYEYTDEYIRTVKSEFLDRALAHIVSLQSDSPAPLMGLIAPGKNGAGVIGEELGKCPHLYCQIGAAGMNVLSAIFGSSTAVSKLLKTVDGDMSETVTEKRMVPAYGTYTFE